MLRLRVPLISGETASSYCSRLAQRNRCRSANEFCFDVGLCFRDVVAGTDEALTVLASLGGLDLTALRGAALRAHGAEYRFGDNAIGSKLRRSMDRLYVCPLCAAEDLSREPSLGISAVGGRVSWLLTPMATCTRHGVALVVADERPETESWGVPQLYDVARRLRRFIGDIDRHVAAAMSLPPTRLEEYLASRLERRCAKLASDLDTMPFYAVADLSPVLGAFLSLGPKATPKKLPEMQYREVAELGFDVLAAGPQALRERLGEGMERWPKGENAASAVGFFGTFHTWLLYRNGNPSYEFIRRAVQDLMFSSHAMRATEAIYGVAPGERRLQSVHIASQELGVHPKRLQKLLIAAGALGEGAATVSHHKAVFPADASSAEVLARIARAATKKQAGEYVNAPQRQFDLLHKAGLVEPFIQSGGKFKGYSFDKRSLDAFLNRLFAHVRGPVPEGARVMSIPSSIKQLHCSVIPVVELVLDGKLVHVYRDPRQTGYMSVLIDPAEVGVALNLEVLPGIALPEATQRLRCTRRVVNALVANGWLSGRTVRHPATGIKRTVIEEESLRWFAAEYVPLSELSREHRFFAGNLKASLDQMCVLPAFDPKDAGAVFYRRRDVCADKMAQIQRASRGPKCVVA